MKSIGKGKWLELVADEKGYEYVRRTRGTDAVVILALTPNDEVILVQQYRPPVQRMVLELPAGIVGDNEKEELFSTAAVRELEEETGWTAGRVYRVGTFSSSAGMTSETVTIVHCKDLSKIGNGGGVKGEEDIKVHLVKKSLLKSFLDDRIDEDMVIDPKVYMALVLL